MNTKDAGHGGFFLYHFVIVLFGCFPASAFIYSAFKKNQLENTNQKHWRWWMIALFCTVLVIFTLVKTKIIHYSSLTYLPLTYLSALTIYYYIENKMELLKIEKVIFIITGIVWLSILFFVPFIGTHINLIKPLLVKDAFAFHNFDALVFWSWIDYFPLVLALMGIFSFYFFLYKKNRLLAFLGLFLFNCMAISLCITFFIPKIEKYTQNSAIEFYQNKSKENASVEVFGYKSYAHYFYSVRTPADQGLKFDSAIDSSRTKKCYFVSKLNKADYFQNKYPVKKLYEKNGFVFFEKIIK